VAKFLVLLAEFEIHRAAPSTWYRDARAIALRFANDARGLITIGKDRQEHEP